jgi:adenylate cyclase
MPQKRKLRVPLRISVSLAFALISVPLIAGIIGVLYYRNAQIAREVAAETIARANNDIADSIAALFSPMAQIVEATATLGKIDRGALRQPSGFRYYLKVLETTPQAQSVYVGFARDGAFYQASRLSGEMQRFGPNGAPPPRNANFALRILDASSGERADSFFYLAKWGDTVLVERGPAVFDPRQRPWYQAAWQQAGISISDVYVFFSSGEPGLTISERIATDDGTAIGAAGIDISLATLSEYLASERVGAHGVAIIMDGAGHLIGYPKRDVVLQRNGGEAGLVMARDVSDPVVAQTVRLREEGAGDRFRAELADGAYFVSFMHLPAQFGKDWLIGVIAAERDFVGPIRRSSVFMLILGAVVVGICIVMIWWVSKSLTQPLARIVVETRRIRNFDLSGNLGIDSRIVEIDELGHALEAMQEDLRTFGAYLPKALVRTIMASGKHATIGGERRTITLLFTDVEDFTRRSEALQPEKLLTELSSYFEAISRAIHLFGGTVDKFIGDAVMAFWNAPLDDADHAVNGCRAVLRCRAVNAQLNADFKARGIAPLPTRFGLHTGEVVVGNVGSDDRMQYTALGAHVNLASRVEGLNKRYGTQLIVTGAVEERARGRCLFRPLDLVVPAGTSQIIPIFELLGALDGADDGVSEAAIEAARQWQAAIDLYRGRNWPAALERFGSYAEQHSHDGTASLYIERCKGFIDAPPPADWDGAEHYEMK